MPSGLSWRGPGASPFDGPGSGPALAARTEMRRGGLDPGGVPSAERCRGRGPHLAATVYRPPVRPGPSNAATSIPDPSLRRRAQSADEMVMVPATRSHTASTICRWQQLPGCLPCPPASREPAARHVRPPTPRHLCRTDTLIACTAGSRRSRIGERDEQEPANPHQAPHPRHPTLAYPARPDEPLEIKRWRTIYCSGSRRRPVKHPKSRSDEPFEPRFQAGSGSMQVHISAGVPRRRRRRRRGPCRLPGAARRKGARRAPCQG